MEVRPLITSIIKDNCNTFSTKGQLKPIRGFEFHVDTGSKKSIYFQDNLLRKVLGGINKKVMQNMIHNGMFEDNTSLRGSLIVLSANTIQ